MTAFQIARSILLSVAALVMGLVMPPYLVFWAFALLLAAAAVISCPLPP
jgi:hypothetical protein